MRRWHKFQWGLKLSGQLSLEFLLMSQRQLSLVVVVAAALLLAPVQVAVPCSKTSSIAFCAQL